MGCSEGAAGAGGADEGGGGEEVQGRVLRDGVRHGFDRVRQMAPREANGSVQHGCTREASAARRHPAERKVFVPVAAHPGVALETDPRKCTGVAHPLSTVIRYLVFTGPSVPLG